MKSKKALLNIITDAIGKILMLIIGILLPKLYIDTYGSEVNGLITSLSGIFVYLSLLEAGIGGASIQALYSPISKGNNMERDEILSATNRFYRKVGVYFLACTAFVAFSYPVIVESSIDFYVIIILILLSAVPTGLRFFVQGKYIVLLNADNRAYVLNIVTTIFNLVSNLLKIILIIYGSNIIYVQAIFAIISVIQIVVIYVYVKKKYNLNYEAEPNYNAIAKKNSVMVHEISSAIFNNIDVLLITIFCGLKVVSVYAIYNLIFMQTGFMVKTISYGLTASFGQLYVENAKKFKEIFHCFEAYYQSIVFSIFITAGLLTTPFLILYTENVNDIQYIDDFLPLLFVIVSILSQIRWPAVVAVNVAGHFKETQWRSLLETALNLIVSTILVIHVGIYGVLIGTILALSYRTIDLIYYSNKYILKGPISVKFIKIFIYSISSTVPLYVYKKSNINIEGYLEFFLVASFVFSSITIFYLLITTIIDRKAFATLMHYSLKMKKNLKDKVA